MFSVMILFICKSKKKYPFFNFNFLILFELFSSCKFIEELAVLLDFVGGHLKQLLYSYD